MRLTDCFVDLVAYVVYFLKTAPSRQPSFDKVKNDIQRLISQTEHSVKNGSFSQEDYDLARFAVFAWIDEAIMNSSWKDRDRWVGEQLQRLYYNTADAGEIFFERLNGLGLHQRDVREVYYLCLAMGFKGRYCYEGDEYLLEQLKTSNLKVLIGSSVGLPSLEKELLFSEAYSRESREVSPTGKGYPINPFTLFCLGVPVLFFFGLFWIYRFVLNHVGENVLSKVP